MTAPTRRTALLAAGAGIASVAGWWARDVHAAVSVVDSNAAKATSKVAKVTNTGAANTGTDSTAATNAPDAATRERKSRDWFTDTPLVDQNGRAHRFYSELLAPQGTRRVVVVHPLYTTCSSACPLIVQRLLHTRAALEPARRRELVILSISVDPLTDTPEVLKAFANKQGADVPGWHFLGGKPQDVERVARRLGLWADAPEDHATVLIAGRAAAAHWAKLRPDLEPKALAQQLDRFW